MISNFSFKFSLSISRLRSVSRKYISSSAYQSLHFNNRPKSKCFSKRVIESSRLLECVRGNSSSITIFHIQRHSQSFTFNGTCNSGIDDHWAATGYRNISNHWDLQASATQGRALAGAVTGDWSGVPAALGPARPKY